MKANKTQSLINHSRKIEDLSYKILDNLSINYNDFLPEKTIKKIIKYVALFHDIGKVDPNFQLFIDDKATSDYSSNGVHLSKKGFSFEDYFRHNELSFFLVNELVEKINGLNAIQLKIVKNIVLWHHAAPIRKESITSSFIKGKLRPSKDLLKINFEKYINEMNEPDLKLRDFENIWCCDEYNMYKYKMFYSEDARDKTLVDIKDDINIEATISLIKTIIITADRLISSLEGRIDNFENIFKDIFSENLEESNLSKQIGLMEKNFYPESAQSKKQSSACKELLKFKDRISILDAPAGAGKTKTSLQWAKINNAKKIYYIVPRAIIAEELFQEMRKDYLPSHVKYELVTGDKKIRWDGKKEVELDHDSVLFNSEIIFTTIDQVIKSVTTHKNITLLLDLMLSHIVFDEYHEYYKMSGIDLLFAEIIRLKGLMKEPNTLIMSATPNYYMLENFLGIYNKRSSNNSIVCFESVNQEKFLIEYLPYEENDFITANTILFEQECSDLKLKRAEVDNIEKEKNPFFQTHKNDIKTIVISNTATTAQLSYIVNGEKEKSLLAHSKYNKSAKKDILSNIKKEFKLLDSKECTVLRSGPIVQASLNITSNKLITEATTIENTLQRLGRLNRFGDKIVGEFIIAISSNFFIVGDDYKVKDSKVFDLLGKNNSKKSSILWLKFLQKELGVKVGLKTSFSIKEMYDIYKGFYSKEEHLEVLGEELIVSLRDSCKNIDKNIVDPIELIGKKNIKEKVVKLSKHSLRSQGFYTKMAIYNMNENSMVLDNEYMEEVSISRRDLLLYNEDFKFISDTKKKLDIIYKDMKKSEIKRIKKLNDQQFLSLSRDLSCPIFVSYSLEDLEKMNKSEQDEESIIYIK